MSKYVDMFHDYSFVVFTDISTKDCTESYCLKSINTAIYICNNDRYTLYIAIFILLHKYCYRKFFSY